MLKSIYVKTQQITIQETARCFFFFMPKFEYNVKKQQFNTY
ncbi:hypothetical protein HMPREF1586_01031 [Gardnerella vaginalis JCP8522]|nr:hypothetical protein HMPREF1586_01031 [Gardnerella vaginalis JCP8522]